MARTLEDISLARSRRKLVKRGFEKVEKKKRKEKENDQVTPNGRTGAFSFRVITVIRIS